MTIHIIGISARKLTATLALVVERVHGKDEVISSNLIGSFLFGVISDTDGTVLEGT